MLKRQPLAVVSMQGWSWSGWTRCSVWPMPEQLNTVNNATLQRIVNLPDGSPLVAPISQYSLKTPVAKAACDESLLLAVDTFRAIKSLKYFELV